MNQVQISSVKGRTCTDSFGRELVRIGNMSVRNGDFVWTDGRCIYGTIQHKPDFVPTFIRSSEEPGIPLNTKYGLLIYTRGHKLYRWGNAKQRGLLNNSKKYSLNSRLGGTRGISDADISSEGKTWEISLTNNGYNETTSCDWLYNGVELDKYWTAKYSNISLMMSIRNLPNDAFRWYIGNQQNTVKQIIKDTVTTDEPSAIILYNGAIIQTISVENCAEYAKNQVKSLIAEVQNSEFKSTLSCSAFLTSAWIDTKGNWCGIVSIKAAGTAYKNYNNIILQMPDKFIVQQLARNRLHWVYDGKIKSHSMVRTVEFKASYQGNWFVENGALVTPVLRSWEMGANEDGGYLDDIDRRLLCGTDFFEQFKEQTAFFDGIRQGTQATQMSRHIKLPGSYRNETDSCFVPLQEDYTIKYVGADAMVDRTTVYKNGVELFKHSGGVYHITALNEKKGEYLFIGGNGVYVVKNGEIKQVFWKGNSFYPNNWRLHYMDNLSDLRRDESKIP